MARFTGPNDITLFKHFSEELVEDIVTTTIQLFKLSINESKTNLYGESFGNVWRAPSTVMCIVDREPMNLVYEGFGPDKQQAVEFRFNRQRCRETSFAVPKVRDVNGTLVPTEAIQNLTVGYPEIGDVVLFDGIYYELDNVRQSALIGGQPQIYNKETNEFEDSRNQLIGVGFMVRRSQIQIDDRIYS